MNKVKVSVVVPVYKVEKYLERCDNSIIKQSLSELEIILVDDGSPDNCGIMCDSFADKDNRIKVVHKANGGLSSARNAGLKIATGEYIGFVDSDDDIETDMYEKMYNAALKYKVDFVMCDYQRINSNSTNFNKTLDIDSGFYDKEKIRSDIFPALIMGSNIDYGPLLSVCLCLYKRQFLTDNSITFANDVKWSEDNLFSAIVGYKCNSFYYLKTEYLYHYYSNPGTITTSYRAGAWNVYCKMNEYLHNFFDQISDYDFSEQLKIHMLYYACNCLGMASKLSEEDALYEMNMILNSQELKTAFKNLHLSDISIKLRFQLYLMKHKKTKVLYKIYNKKG